SGNASPSKGDNPCTFPNPKTRKLCFLFQQPIDTRFYQASGPFSLDAGGSATIVVAYVHGAPVASKLLGGKIGGDVKPGIPPNGTEIAGDPTLVRAIDSIAGWVTQADNKTVNGAIEQNEVTVVPRSLLDKALVAQAVFDTRFLLPFAPEPPSFHLVPGDNQVAVVWTKSTTETTGDPYFSVASNPANPALYDPNFRKIDVEGYRVYRGRTTAQLELIAQFDYDGSTFTDFTGTAVHAGSVDYGNRCAPELGIQVTCPVNFNAGQSEVLDIVDPFIQVKRGDRVQLADGTVFIIKADTALTSAGFPALDNTGVPFAFIDKGVRNSFNYFYAVTAFDLNSLKSGPSSLESARITKSATPRAPSPNQVNATLISGLFGDDNTQLDPRSPWSIDPNTGRFSGAPPATDALTGVFAPLVPALLPALNLTAKIDSLVPHSDADFTCGANSNALGACYEVFITFNKDGQITPFRQVVYWPVWSAFGEPVETELALGSFDIPADAAAAQRFGIPANFSKFQAKVGATLHQYIAFSDFEGQSSRRAGTVGIPNMGGGAGVSPGGSRWFDGANETVDHPTYSIRLGKLAGTDTVWAPIHHTDTDPATPGVQQYAQSSAMQCFGYILAGLGRAADVQFTWGANGTISGVRDLTHHVNLPFKTGPQGSYGFVDDFNGNGRIDWRDFHYLETISPAADNAIGTMGFCGHTDPGAGARGQLLQQPKIMAVSTRGDVGAEAGNNGFGLYVNGERYIIRLTGGNAPASGAKWTLRTYAGYVRASSGAATTTPGSYTLIARPRPPIIPNLQVVFKVAKATELAEETDSTLMKVHTVPD
ncbi:MAG: hypothetical protein HY560_02605, partial [Gemmatimonadetes bacterium]|nr:hypothetical protein [Gemmatimonadota bacterium]